MKPRSEWKLRSEWKPRSEWKQRKVDDEDKEVDQYGWNDDIDNESNNTPSCTRPQYVGLRKVYRFF